MKVIILAGGLGTRLSEYTQIIPKPMVTIGGKPIIWHIMNSYAKYDFTDFVVATGYKSDVIKDYFLNYRAINSDFTVDLATGKFYSHNVDQVNWLVTLINTGEKSLTGTRIKKLKKYIDGQRFMLTYGDGVTDLNIKNLLDFHIKHGKLATVTAVRPTARFGELEFNGLNVTSFTEKPQLHDGWINGGYFIFEPEFIDMIADNDVMLEKQPLDDLVKANQLVAYKHEGFWHCMDTKRDHELLENIWLEGNAPWM